ncbi:MAG: hypothetical protein ACPHCI_06885 [Solirubrobacterales bacterium]
MKLPSLIRWISAVACAVFAISFGVFVWDELGAASDGQKAKISGTPTTITRDTHGRMVSDVPAPRWRFELDRFNDMLTAPGESVARQAATVPSPWTIRGFALIFGVIVFGFGLRFGANWLERAGSGRRADPVTGFTPGYR